MSQKSSPLSIDVVANIDGTDNFKDSYSPGSPPCFRARSASVRPSIFTGLDQQHQFGAC